VKHLLDDPLSSEILVLDDLVFHRFGHSWQRNFLFKILTKCLEW
jgi:DNA replication protein DnaC